MTEQVKDPKIQFESENDAQRAEGEMTQLVQMPGWQRLRNFMEQKIRYFEYLLKEGDIKNLDELKLIRFRRDLSEQFMNLPEIISEVIKMQGGKDIVFDPYSGIAEKPMTDPDPYPKNPEPGEEALDKPIA